MSIIPRKLAKALKEAGYIQRELARRLGINPKYINDFFKKSKEPSNPEIRAKMFLPRKPRQERHPGPTLPAWLKRRKRAIAKLAKDTRKAINER